MGMPMAGARSAHEPDSHHQRGVPLGARPALLVCDMHLEPTTREHAEGTTSPAVYHASPKEDDVISSPGPDLTHAGQLPEGRGRGGVAPREQGAETWRHAGCVTPPGIQCPSVTPCISEPLVPASFPSRVPDIAGAKLSTCRTTTVTRARTEGSSQEPLINTPPPAPRGHPVQQTVAKRPGAPTLGRPRALKVTAVPGAAPGQSGPSHSRQHGASCWRDPRGAPQTLWGEDVIRRCREARPHS